MKNIVFFIGLLCFTHASFGQSMRKHGIIIPYSISIVQGDKSYDLFSQDTIHLERDTFRFEVTLIGIEGFYLSASFNDEYFMLPANKAVKDWEYISAKAMVEEPFNTDRDLLIDDECFSYWFYDPELDWYRFDEGLKHNGQWVSATYTVATMFNADTKTELTLKDIDRPIYLFAFYIDKEKRKPVKQAAGRTKAVILFN